MPRLLLLILFVTCSPEVGRPLQADEVAGTPADTAPAPSPVGVAAKLTSSVEDAELRRLIEETLERNPGVRAIAAEANAAGWRAERQEGLPDLTASVTGFLETPETRVGPQRFMATVGQSLPWGGKRALAAQVELHTVDLLTASAEAERLALVTEVRRLHNELALVGRLEQIAGIFRDHLLRHEEVARSRYMTGSGTGQGVLKMQAEITKVDRRLLDLESRGVSLLARLNELRDRPAADAISRARQAEVVEVTLDQPTLLARATMNRPEIRGADAMITRTGTQEELAQKRFRPDFRVGVTYTMVDERRDAPGKLQPPPDNGKDIFGIQGAISIPLWRQQRSAGLEETLELRSAAESRRSEILAGITARVGDLVEKIGLTWQQIRLLEDLLLVQAEEALGSAQAAYVGGKLSALELFDAEHVLFEAETAVARARTDYLIAIAELEGVVGEPIDLASTKETS